ncbi:MAG: hypothetical protein QOF21_2394, partial [Actinomycetota bacterium]
PYWDFFVTEKDLEMRRDTRIGTITRVVGVRRFMRLLALGQRVLNLLPFVRSQGNKFIGVVVKQELQPWIEVRDGVVRLRPGWRQG